MKSRKIWWWNSGCNLAISLQAQKPSDLFCIVDFYPLTKPFGYVFQSLESIRFWKKRANVISLSCWNSIDKTINLFLKILKFWLILTSFQNLQNLQKIDSWLIFCASLNFSSTTFQIIWSRIKSSASLLQKVTMWFCSCCISIYVLFKLARKLFSTLSTENKSRS